MGKYNEDQQAQRDNGENSDTNSNFSSAHHVARQDGALEQLRTGEDWGLPTDYAISKVIQRTQENDAAHGDSGK